MKNGSLIVIEGVDGSGKNTQAKILQTLLVDRGIKAELVGFPDYSGSFLGKTIGEMLSGNMGDINHIHPKFTSAIFAIERFEKKDHIQRRLDDGVVVICDRYVYSNIAHQACRLPFGERREFMNWLLHLEFEILKLPAPTTIILLDLDQDDSKKLREQRSPHSYSGTSLDLHEQDLNGLATARDIYLSLAEEHNWITIKCSSQTGLRTVADISESIASALNITDK